MRNSLLLLLALSFSWISVQGNNLVSSINTSYAGPVRMEASNTDYNALNTSTVFGRMVMGMAVAAPIIDGCNPNTQSIIADPASCDGDLVWNVPTSANASLDVDFPKIYDGLNGTGAELANNFVGSSYGPVGIGNYSVVYQFTNADGDAQCILNFSVVDEVAPTVVDCKAATYNENADVDCEAKNVVIDVPEFADVCSTPVVVTFTLTDPQGAVVEANTVAVNNGTITRTFPLGTSSIVWSVADASGNALANACTTTIEVDDVTAPMWVGTVDNTVYPNVGPIANNAGECFATQSFVTPTATDNCDTPIVVTWEVTGATTANGTGNINALAFNSGVSTVTFTATDNATNFVDYSFTVEVTDQEGPVVAGCPGDFTYVFNTSNNGTGDCDAEVTIPEVLLVDNCAPSAAMTRYAEVLPKDTNFAGVLASSVDAPLNVTLSVDTFVVALYGEDDLGNMSDTCYSLIAVIDDEKPEWTAVLPDDITIYVQDDCDSLITPDFASFSDNILACNAAGLTVWHTIDFAIGTDLDSTTGVPSITNFPIGTSTVELFIQDQIGVSHRISDDIMVTVLDTIRPTIDTDVFAGGTTNTSTASVDANCEASFTISGVTVDDNCEVVSVVNDFNGADLWNSTTMTVGSLTATVPVGTTKILYTVTDASANTWQDTVVLVAEDNTVPTLFNLPNLNEAVEPGICSFTKTFDISNNFGPKDNCELDSLTIEIDTDDNGSWDSTLVYYAPFAGQEWTHTFAGPDANDDLETVRRDVVRIRTVDAAGNASIYKQFTVDIYEDQAPEIFQQDTFKVFVNDITCSAAQTTIIFTDALVSDNCASDDVLLANMVNDYGSQGDTVTGSFAIDPPLGPFHEITFTTHDGNGNTASKTVVVWVVDELGPDITLNNIPPYDNDIDVCSAKVKVFAPATSDACGIASVEYSINGGPFMTIAPTEIEFVEDFPVGTSDVAWRVEDINGNVVIDTQKVVVNDIQLPNATNPADVILYSTATDCEVDGSWDFPVYTDNCGMDDVRAELITNGDDTLAFANGPVTGTFNADSTYKVNIYATDIHGNQLVESYVINVMDTIAPAFTCPPANYAVNVDSANCVATITFIENGQFLGEDIVESCGISTYAGNKAVTGAFDPTVATTFPIGSTAVTITVTDINGNAKVCTFNVVVSDDIEAHLTNFPDDITVTATANECSKIVFWDTDVASADCGTNAIRWNITSAPTTGLRSGSDFPLGTTTITYEFSDLNGNTLTKTFTVTVTDDQAPVIKQGPTDITLYTSGGNCEVLYTWEIDAQDNCDAQGLDITADIANGTNLLPGTYTNTIVVTDVSGNSVTNPTYTITVIDDDAPILNVPADVSTCDVNYDFETATATDNCDVTVIYSLSVGNLVAGANVITVTADDGNGNVVTEDFTVTLRPAITNVEAGNDADICEAGSINLAASAANAANGEVGTWTSPTKAGANFADVNNPNTQVTFTGTGEYNLVWTVSNGGTCPDVSDIVAITVVEEAAAANAGVDFAVEATSTNLNATLINTNDAVGTWTVDAASTASISSPNLNTTEVTNLSQGENIFTWTVDNGVCGSTSDDVIVTVNYNLADAVPTGITPDGDGKNDTWAIPGLSDYTTAKVQVFNRYGNIVFESTGYDVEWDGTNEGEELPVASYYYVIDLGDGSSPLSGIISIIK